jgi:hypothetical protein
MESIIPYGRAADPLDKVDTTNYYNSQRFFGFKFVSRVGRHTSIPVLGESRLSIKTVNHFVGRIIVVDCRCR